MSEPEPTPEQVEDEESERREDQADEPVKPDTEKEI